MLRGIEKRLSHLEKDGLLRQSYNRCIQYFYCGFGFTYVIFLTKYTHTGTSSSRSLHGIEAYKFPALELSG